MDVLDRRKKREESVSNLVSPCPISRFFSSSLIKNKHVNLLVPILFFMDQERLIEFPNKRIAYITKIYFLWKTRNRRAYFYFCGCGNLRVVELLESASPRRQEYHVKNSSRQRTKLSFQISRISSPRCVSSEVRRPLKGIGARLNN